MLNLCCPACGKQNIALSFAQYLKRNYTMSCKFCDYKTTSHLSFRSYFFLIVYVQIITVVTGAPLVLAILGGFWFFAAAALFSFFLLTIPPAMALHIRNLRKERSEPR
jgi:uncharacterized protein (DUF983 family)